MGFGKTIDDVKASFELVEEVFFRDHYQEKHLGTVPFRALVKTLLTYEEPILVDNIKNNIGTRSIRKEDEGIKEMRNRVRITRKT